MNTAAPGNPSQRYATLLSRLIGSKDWPRALNTAREWLAEDPVSAQAHLSAGQALINLERHAEALPHLRKTLEVNPNHAFAHRLASSSYFHSKDFRQADEHIQQAIALQPNEATHWYQLAWMRYMHGAPDLAAKHAARALELAPENSNVVNLLALCQRNKPKARLAQYERALELDPENAVVHSNIGLYRLHVDGDGRAAEACFRRALQINPADKGAQKNLLLALRQRHWGYQLLRFPLSMWDRTTWARKDFYTLAHVVVLGLCLATTYFWFIIFGWVLLVFPLQKAYEYLTLGDIQAQAGVIGARRGGLLGYRRWPFAVRLGVFALLTLLFWGGVGGLALWLKDHGLPEAFVVPLTLILVAAGLIYCVLCVVRLGKRVRLRAIANRSEKRFKRQMKARQGDGLKR